MNENLRPNTPSLKISFDKIPIFFQATHVTTHNMLLHLNRFNTAAMHFIRSNNLKLIDGEEQKKKGEELLLPATTRSKAVQTT